MDVETKRGYKMTEVGLIPIDWECKELENYFSFISYGFTNPMPLANEGVYMITAADVNYGCIQLSTARRTTKEAYNALTAKSKPQKNDILLTKDGTLGRLAIVEDSIVCINQSVAVIRPNSKVNPLFIKQLLESRYYQQVMIENAGGSTIKHIYITIVNKMKVGIPYSLTEQTAIANALKDTDDFINSLENLIAKKKLIKQGAMQELLKPKEGWVKKKLGDVGNIITGSTPPTSIKKFWDGNIPWITPTDISIQKDIKESERKITLSGLQANRNLPKNTLLVTCIASIGKNAILRCDGACNQQINAIIPFEDYDVDFMYYLMENNKKYLLGNAGITATLMISKKDFSQIIFSFPNKSEQIFTSRILSDMDTEIQTLENKLLKYQTIKQGMMQQLLTGKIRLV